MYYGDSVGVGAELDRILAARFVRDAGIAVDIVPKPQSAAENCSSYQRIFEARSPEFDVLMLDVIWPGAFAPHLVDLGQRLGGEASEHYQALVENNTVAGKLVGMPWFGDFGMLYCRADLLEKYGFGSPPATWEQLEGQARRVAEGERGRNPSFSRIRVPGCRVRGTDLQQLSKVACLQRRWPPRGEWSGDDGQPARTGHPDQDARLGRHRRPTRRYIVP